MSIQSNNKVQSDPKEHAPELLGIEAAARRLGLSAWTLRRWVIDKKLSSVKLGARRLIPVTEITRLIREGMQGRVE